MSEVWVPQPSVVPDVYVVVRRGDDVLLLFRDGTGYKDGEWGPPSGKVEAGETYAAAAVRELAEEVGIEVAEDDLTFLHVVERREYADPTPWVGLFFAVDSDQEPTNREPDKHRQLGWFPAQDLPPTTIAYVAHVVAAVARGEPYSHWTE